MKTCSIAVFSVMGALAACSDANQTAIDLSISYEDSWNLSELQVTTGDRSTTLAAEHQLTILVPDDSAGTEIRLEVVGLQGTESWARGTTLVTPVLGETVTDEMGLALLSCATSCEEDALSCRSGGVAQCAQGANSCFDWSAPEPCGGDTPTCSLGACVPAAEMVHPSNADVVGELADTGLILDVPTGSIFDTTTNCSAGSALGNCATVSPPDLPQVCVCRSDELTIHDLEVRGTRALAILARRSVTISGLVTVKPGAGASPISATWYSDGGSYGTPGGGMELSDTWGTFENIPLIGGMGGEPTDGGAGGGAIQITADDVIRVDGGITTPGGGGKNDSCRQFVPNAGAGGSSGGSGGAILLEAREVSVGGGLSSNGGGGSGGDVMTDAWRRCAADGEDGHTGMTQAAGTAGMRRTDCSGPNVSGGDAGSGSLGDSAGVAGVYSTNAGEDQTCDGDLLRVYAGPGGGGGGAGRIRINTATPDQCDCAATFSPTPTFGTTALQ